ncbi:MAG TPA: ABC transporter ATP-binding protein [Oligoflexia bacterium]|nr:ABC transporter ATP-binding protein [Oligoflexia bacterium]HMP26944.1 ABC transporter ATP-binding protein [Oligoflexia bacterium]
MIDTKPLKIEYLTYVYRSDFLRLKRCAVSELSLEVENGEIFGLLGPNGAGKTTTIKGVLNLIRPTKGRIEIFGKNSRWSDARQKVGYLSEQPYFYDYLTVREILTMYGTLVGLSGANLKSEVKRTLRLVRLEDRIDSKMRSLSKGLTQRVAMAQAILNRPSLVILDEPFSGLDPIGRREFRELILKLRDDGASIIISTHVLSDVELLCDCAAILVKGKLRGIFNIGDLPKGEAQSYELVVVDQVNQAIPKEFEVAEEQKKHHQLLILKFKEEESARLALTAAINKNLSVVSFNPITPSFEDHFVKIVNQ